EQEFTQVHISSLSLDSVIFKLQGVPDLLPRVFPELMDENFRSVMALGHSRYSTNTLPTIERTQPFSLLGHNGEINTIERLRFTGRALGIQPVPDGSDSQDLNRIIEGLVNHHGLDIIEAFEMVFPAIYSEGAQYSRKLQEVYAFYRWFFPSSAQGPAAVVCRFGDVCLGSVDALGLRPLWLGESDYSYFLSSEKGVVDLEHTMHDPRPLGPGEKIAIYGGRGIQAEVVDYGGFQKRLIRLLDARPRTKRYSASLYKGLPPRTTEDEPVKSDTSGIMPPRNLLSAFGWQQYDIDIRKQVSHYGREVIGSLGFTGPLAAFSPESLPNISDYAKEMVAVVTNPAIDREREREHFSLRTILGSRPDSSGDKSVPPLALELQSPLLLDKLSLAAFVEPDICRKVSREFNTCLFEDVHDFFTGNGRDDSLICLLDSTFSVDSNLMDRVEELCQKAAAAVKNGAVLVIIDDTASFADRRIYIDPALILVRLNEVMVSHGLRREAGIIVRSGAIRNLHDIMFMLGLGADGLVPYLLYRVACANIDESHSGEAILRNNLAVLHKGMEKVMSTMGIHELCGYGRIFATLGLTREFAFFMGVKNFCAAENTGLDARELERLAKDRYERADTADEQKIYRYPLRNPKIGKILRAAAQGRKDHAEMAAQIADIDASLPTGIRHLLDFKYVNKKRKVSPAKVDITIGSHAMPLVIAAMSFGSQGENSFRTYADAARLVNIICINGEGGEIPDMLGKYRKNRGQQLASGRFGVFMAFINSVDYLEIKIGQGAKPGEGGHLPGAKVTTMVASARHCKPGITLISPSNHHDIYSIEDLAQIITELKTANPQARISVKVPITSGIGTIAVGIAKAGADIINLSGYEGGTGAARQHAKRFVGLPAEIGVSEAHRALLESCLRDSVELWVDGGMRSGADVLKMILLGANRVGFGTAALMGIGCISCERCHLDRCPRGISTQLGSNAEARARGVKGFAPRIVADETDNLARLLTGIGNELKMHVAALGEVNLQDIVGRTDLLEQTRFTDRISVSDILSLPVHICDPDQYPMPQITRKPLNHLTRLISDL
ncbi:MAG: alpha-hydroxy-acid oxidizing protein, partial [Deltaproteobacteria bacterium]|nr:alpha-hydroxy-acid oxidizing protein [Deltaproteobacteria bacterium]